MHKQDRDQKDVEPGDCFEIVISLPDQEEYDRLGHTGVERRLAMRDSVREGMSVLLQVLQVEEARWVAAIHLHSIG